MKDDFIAHFRSSDHQAQKVHDHLKGVAGLSRRFAGKIGMSGAGEILGLLHDLGKYSAAFQIYIKSATGLLDPDIDGDTYVDAEDFKGRIDHSTAGAQWVWQRLKGFGPQGRLVGQILAICLASHHGGLMDCLRVDGTDGFDRRMDKSDEKTHLAECLAAGDREIMDVLENISPEAFLKDVLPVIRAIAAPGRQENDRLKHFRLGLLARFLFSCLVDADRIDSADFETPENKAVRPDGPVPWQVAVDRLEERLFGFKVRNHVDALRNRISGQCLARAAGPRGLYTLTVPTGGGKTFASIRYALHHAKAHGMDHIIYVIPYTSIIEQNAAVVREVLEREGDALPWVLEHHSNLEPEHQTWQSKLSSESWDAPVIFTTMVQFLEAMFGSGTREARRMHNLGNAVVIFDEIQSLPVNCVHLFCNGLQFLADHAGTTAVLCTATQPLLGEVDPDFGRLELSKGNELAKDTAGLFDALERVSIENAVRPGGWTRDEIAGLALDQVREKGNCLVIVNTKAWARDLYEACSPEMPENTVFHLSTSLCPAHRKHILSAVKARLEGHQPVLCISTQLVEAGVDIDFNAVIRFLAGLDAIAQAAGRCNRNGNLETGRVHVVNPDREAIDLLADIKAGRDKAQRVLGEGGFRNFLGPSAMARYFSYYFYDRKDVMGYPVSADLAGRPDTLVSLLSDNSLNIGRRPDLFRLQQSFKTAGRLFKAIDAPTRAVIVPYGPGREIIADLCAAPGPSETAALLAAAQKYCVNLFPHTWQKLIEADAVRPVRDGPDIHCLDERHYSPDFGVSVDAVSTMDAAII